MAMQLSRLSLSKFLKLSIQHILLGRSFSYIPRSGLHLSCGRNIDDAADGCRAGPHKKSLKVKLHNRVLTGIDKEHEKTHLQEIPCEDGSDSFGRLERTKRGSRFDRVLSEQDRINERDHILQNSTSSEFDTFGDIGRGKNFSRLKFATTSTRDHLESIETGETFGHFGRNSSPRTETGKWEDGATKQSSASASTRGKRPKRRYSAEADIFGTISEGVSHIGAESMLSEIGSHNERFPDDENDEPEKHHIRLDVKNRRHIPFWYDRKIVQFGKEGKVKEAVAVLEEWMLSKDRVMPSSYTFTAVIGVLGRVGYTQKAFKLFNKMKKMGLHPGDATYTALFNACSNSPWQTDALSRADKLRELMTRKGFEPNLLTYNAMIKTYGMFGDIKTAFKLMDELTGKYRPTEQTFSFLLMACISDKKAGFKHAVEVWRLLQKFRLNPDLPLYNLLLRVVRDCGAGDADFANTLLPVRQEVEALPLTSPNEDAVPRVLDLAAGVETDPDSRQIYQPSAKQSGGYSDSSSTSSDAKLNCSNQGPVAVGETEWWQSDSVQDSNLPSKQLHQLNNLPNLLEVDSKLCQVVSLGDLSQPDGRLAVIGGAAGLLKAMQRDHIQPNISTFSQLIEVAPPTVEAETALLGAMEVLRVVPDIVLYNSIIHRRCMRKDLDAARDVLKMISVSRLHPDMKTFGCLAMTCNRRKDGLQLLEDMEHAGLSPNIEVLGTLSYVSKLDFGYKLAVLQYVEELGLSPNDKFIEGVELHIANAKRKIVQTEKGLAENSYIKSHYFTSTFKDFMVSYKIWLKKTQIQKTAHPWDDFMKKREDRTKKTEESR